MTLYCTPALLAEWYGLVELAQAAAPPEGPSVETALLAATLDGGDRTAWTDEEREAADRAAAFLEAACRIASREADSYLASAMATPLSALAVQESSLPRAAGDMARAMIWRQGGTEAIHEAARMARQWLRDIAAGRARLGSVNSEPARSGLPEFVRGKARFDLAGFLDAH